MALFGLFGSKDKVISGDCENGFGTFQWKSGNVYEGNWKNGEKHGKGILTFADKSVYNGEFKDGKRHGKATMKWADGNVYTGAYEDDKRSGFGKMTYSGGGSYEGEWKNNLMHGEGTITWSRGDVHKGTFVEDKMHGYGEAEYFDGRIRKGTWENDEFKTPVDEIITDNVPMPWRRLPPRTGHLVEMVKAEVANAKAQGKVPFLFYSALFANACNKMREFRRQMPEAYEGAYIIELMVDDWGAEEMNQIKYVTGIPFMMEIDGNAKLQGDKALKGEWGETFEDDNLVNIRKAVTEYVQARVKKNI
ncbi:MAG TPA: hypothetical protein VK177_21190 [Flavobacteriales bacterium]|nr:hypothetical protein [Flavobacteriales bacterium]